MHSLNITGDTPEALYLNVVKTLSLFLRGPQTTAAVTTADVDAARPEAARSEVREDEKTTVLPKSSRKNAKAKASDVPSDDIPDLAGGKIIEHDANEGKAKELTLADDIIPRLQAIQKACTARGMSMPACVAFIQKLYGPFGIANAKQLKPEQFEEFLEASEAYLKGDA